MVTDEQRLLRYRYKGIFLTWNYLRNLVPLVFTESLLNLQENKN